MSMTKRCDKCQHFQHTINERGECCVELPFWAIRLLDDDPRIGDVWSDGGHNCVCFSSDTDEVSDE
jgi:hypothetical protein